MSDTIDTSQVPAAAQRRSPVAAMVRRLQGAGGALIAFVVLVVYLAATQPFFLTQANIFNVLTGTSSMLIAAIGLTFVILAAGFDLSIGAIFAASGYVVYATLSSGVSEPLAILAGLLVATVLGGAVNGVLVGKIRLNFFVVTLGTASLFSGLLSVLTGGRTNSLPAAEGTLIHVIGSGTLLGVPVPVLIALLVLAAAWYVLRFTPYGRSVYAVGGNPEAARLAGINVGLVLVSVYGLAGLLAGAAGVVDASRLASASPTAGASLALSAGAAVLLGGTSFFGGVGGVGGTVIGVLLIAFLQNGLGLIGISAFWQDVVTGVVLILAVLLDKLRMRA